MSDLGDDYKEVIAEIGEAVIIVRKSGNISGEFIKAQDNAQVTKPFIREFFLEADFTYDTQILAGDVLQLTDSRKYLVMNSTPRTFEGSIFKKTAMLYKCNTAGGLYRPTTRRIDGKAKTFWSEIANPCHALLTESFYGHELDAGEAVGPVSKLAMDCYMPHTVGAQKGDRLRVSPTESYQIESIMTRRFDSVDLILLGEDTREKDMAVVRIS